MAHIATKRKCIHYHVEYQNYGFITAPSNDQVCLLREKVFSNEVVKSSRLSDHLRKIHSDKAGQHLSYF